MRAVPEGHMQSSRDGLEEGEGQGADGYTLHTVSHRMQGLKSLKKDKSLKRLKKKTKPKKTTKTTNKQKPPHK